MKNGTDCVQEVPNMAQAKMQRTVSAQPDNALLSHVTQAVEAFRTVEGEKMLAQMLESLLSRSQGVLASYGIQMGAPENGMVRKMREHIEKLEQRCREGDAENRELRLALDIAEGRTSPAA